MVLKYRVYEWEGNTLTGEFTGTVQDMGHLASLIEKNKCLFLYIEVEGNEIPIMCF